MRDWQASRRALLGRLGAGAALLPLMPHRFGYSADPIFPRRLIIVVTANGYPKDKYVPGGAGTSLASLNLSDVFTALNPWKGKLLMLPPMECTNAIGSEDYHRAYSMMFTGGPPVSKPRGAQSVWQPTRPSIDQIIGSEAVKREQVVLRSLPLQLPFGNPAPPDGTLEAKRAFWGGMNQPVTPEISPYRVVDQHFGGKAVADPAMDRLRAEKKSMLDYVAKDLERFAMDLGSEDKSSIVSHLQGVRDIEKSLVAPAMLALPGVPASVANAGQPLDFNSLAQYPKLLEIQFDLAVAALRSNLTRVATVQLGPAWGDDLGFPWLPAAGRDVWHRIAHSDSDEKQAWDTWLMGRFAALLQRLDAVPEVGPNSKTMLDNTIVLWATNMLDGNHGPRLPWLIAGGGGGRLRVGQYLRSGENQSINRVLTGLCNAMDVPVDYVGDATIKGPLPGMLV